MGQILQYDFADRDDPVFEYLRDGSGTDLILNYAAAPYFARVTVPAGEAWAIYSINFYIEDAGGFPPGGFAAGAALTNGFNLQHRNAAADTVLREFFGTGELVKTNSALEGLAGVFRYDVLGGAGVNAITGRFDFDRSGYPVIINSGETFGLNLADDLTVLTRHKWFVRGRRVSLVEGTLRR